MLLMTLFNSSLDASHAHPDQERPYTEDPSFALEQYQWRNRVLVVSAKNVDDNDLMQQLGELESTHDEFADRDLILVTLLDDSVPMADGRDLANTEVVAAREALGIRRGSFALRLIGKDGLVKLSAKKATPMSEIYALIDSMPMRQREQSKR
jgi:hypothetical protein